MPFGDNVISSLSHTLTMGLGRASRKCMRAAIVVDVGKRMRNVNFNQIVTARLNTNNTQQYHQSKVIFLGNVHMPAFLAQNLIELVNIYSLKHQTISLIAYFISF